MARAQFRVGSLFNFLNSQIWQSIFAGATYWIDGKYKVVVGTDTEGVSWVFGLIFLNLGHRNYFNLAGKFKNLKLRDLTMRRTDSIEIVILLCKTFSLFTGPE